MYTKQAEAINYAFTFESFVFNIRLKIPDAFII